MMTEVCEYLRNWFDRGMPRFTGTFTISDGAIMEDLGILEGQYFRIMGSVLNDGVWRYPQEPSEVRLRDETFTGTVALMAVPPALVAISEEIDEWQAKYGGVGGTMMSPFSSESFGGYSYSKAQGGTLSNGASVTGWQNAYGARLMRWKKL